MGDSTMMRTDDDGGAAGGAAGAGGRRAGALLGTVLALAVVAVMAGNVLLAKVGGGLLEPLLTLDGTYQTYGMLERTARGLRPGADFVPYLGPLLCLALYPAFALLGGTVFAAFGAAELAVQAVWFATLWLLAWAAGAGRAAAFRWAAALFLLFFATFCAWEMFKLAYSPGISLITLRDSAPVWLAAAMAGVRARQWRHRVMAAGAGIMLFWSPTAGAATLLVTIALLTMGALFADKAGQAGQQPPRARIMALGVNLAVLGAAVLVTATVLSRGAPLGLLRRIFVETGQVQFWYFGSFADGMRVLSLADMARVLAPDGLTAMSLVLLGVVAVRTWWHNGPASARADAVALVLGSQFLSAIAAQVGGHLMTYYYTSFLYSGWALATLMILYRVVGAPAGGATGGTPGVAAHDGSRLERGMQAAPLLVLAGTLALNPAARSHAAPLFAPLDRTRVEPLAEAAMPFPVEARREVAFLRQARAELDRARVPAERRMFGTYQNWADVMVGASGHPRFNSVITLPTPADQASYSGWLRRNRPAWVTTVDRDASPWALWNERASWFFLREVLANYTPVARGTTMVYWRRRTAPAPAVTAPLPTCRIIRRSDRAVDLALSGAPQTGAAYAEIALAYRADPGRAGWNGDLGRGYVRVTDRSSGLLRYLARQQAAGLAPDEVIGAFPGLRYGLPTGDQHQTIPVVQAGSGPSTVSLDLQGGARAALQVQSCRATAWHADPLADGADGTSPAVVRLAQPYPLWSPAQR